MGVKTLVLKEDLKTFIEVENIYETKNGVSDTVYICDDKYVLKLFENSTEDIIQNEIDILDMIKELPCVKLDSTDIIHIKNKPCLIYKKCRGDILEKAEKEHIEQIGIFLNHLHKITKNKRCSNIKLFEKKRLKELISQTGYKPFNDIFEEININLKDDGIIHGDLFLDNALFKDNRLSCVIDFSEACSGDFLFDLAVAASAWCKNDKEIEYLLNSYGTKIESAQFKEYIKYALLYYSVTRYLDNRDYRELLERLKCI